MLETANVCKLCWNQVGCDGRLSPQLISRHRVVAKIADDDIRYSQSACRHFTCTSGGQDAAEDAQFVGKYEVIITAEGLKKAVTFESEDKRTMGLRWITEDGVIYSCEEKGGMYFKTGQRLDEFGVMHY